MLSTHTNLIMKSLSSPLEMNGKYIGNVEIDNRIFAFGEVTKIRKDKYQIVPVDEKYRDALSFLTESETNKIGKSKVNANVDGKDYEGPVIIIDGKNVTISNTKIVSDLSDYESALNVLKIDNKKLKEDANRVKYEDNQTIAPQNIKHTALFSVPAINAANSTSKEIIDDIQKRSKKQQEELDKVFENDLEELKKNPHQKISHSSVFVVAQFSPNINLADLMKKIREDEKEDAKQEFKH